MILKSGAFQENPIEKHACVTSKENFYGEKQHVWDFIGLDWETYDARRVIIKNIFYIEYIFLNLYCFDKSYYFISCSSRTVEELYYRAIVWSNSVQ